MLNIRTVVEVPKSLVKLHGFFCGCATPETAWEWVLEYLEATSKENAYFTRIGEKEYRNCTGPEMISLYLMDHCGLTEHGGSVYGAWLSEDGWEALEFLRKHIKSIVDRDPSIDFVEDAKAETPFLLFV